MTARSTHEWTKFTVKVQGKWHCSKLCKQNNATQSKVKSIRVVVNRPAWRNVMPVCVYPLVYAVGIHTVHTVCEAISAFTLYNKKLGCRREIARCFVSLNISLSHSRSLKIIETGIYHSNAWLRFPIRLPVTMALSSSPSSSSSSTCLTWPK